MASPSSVMVSLADCTPCGVTECTAMSDTYDYPSALISYLANGERIGKLKFFKSIEPTRHHLSTELNRMTEIKNRIIAPHYDIN